MTSRNQTFHHLWKLDLNWRETSKEIVTSSLEDDGCVTFGRRLVEKISSNIAFYVRTKRACASTQFPPWFNVTLDSLDRHRHTAQKDWPNLAIHFHTRIDSCQRAVAVTLPLALLQQYKYLPTAFRFQSGKFSVCTIPLSEETIKRRLRIKSWYCCLHH